MDRFASEGYVFAAFCFWIFCFGMSRYSMYVERKLGPAGAAEDR